MKTSTFLPGLIALAFVLGACGSAPPDTGASAPGNPAESPVSDPDSPVSSTPDPNATLPPGDRAQKVKPRPGMADVRAVGWDKAKPSASGRSLRVTYWSGVEPCNVLDRVKVDYSASKITVTLFEGHDPDAGDVACIEIALLKVVKVALDEPVDGRKIVDGAR